jgi:MFS family permease
VSGTLFALFAVALGYGTLVPLVPVYLGASGGGDVAWHTGALPAVFLAAASLAAPLWGHVSDRMGRRVVIAAGCAGAALAVVPFLVEHGLPQLYLLQAVAGVSFGAVLPAALAMLYEAGDARARARRVAWYGVALLGGYLAGPALGGWLAGLAEGAAALAAHRAVQLALGAQAAAAALALLRVGVGHWPKADSPRETPAAAPRAREALAALLAAMLVALLLGGFEIGAALHLRGPLGFGSAEVAGLFIACGATMALVQLVVLPRVPASASRVAWALALVAASGAALAAMPFARSYVATLALASPLGGALGLAFGLLGLQMASAGGARRGLALGAQNAAITGGQAAGSLLGGALFAAFGERALPGFGAGIILLALALAALMGVRRARARGLLI